MASPARRRGQRRRSSAAVLLHRERARVDPRVPPAKDERVPPVSDTPDVAIIGSGVGGSAMARAIAPSGAKVLVIERGEPVRAGPHPLPPQAVFTDVNWLADETWYERSGRAFNPVIYYYVGGEHQVLRGGDDALPGTRLRGGGAPGRALPCLALLLRRDGALVLPGGRDLPGTGQGRRRSARSPALPALPPPPDSGRAFRRPRAEASSKEPAFAPSPARSAWTSKHGSPTPAPPGTATPTPRAPRRTPKTRC